MVEMSGITTNHSRPGAAPKAQIYVVDDEPMLLELASVILEPQGYQLKTFRDPEAAVQSFSAAQPRPELIITDYAMHNMNGMQLTRRFRQIDPAVKILLVSGTVGADIFRNESTRPDHFLPKPYQPGQLTEVVKSLLAEK